MSDDRIRTLVACGAAGGIAATFNAPVAGVIFAMEVILGEFAIANFSTVVIASVTASVVARIFMGDVPCLCRARIYPAGPLGTPAVYTIGRPGRFCGSWVCPALVPSGGCI